MIGKPLLKATSIASAMTFLSRIFGLARDTIIAQTFGAGLAMDAFIVAFRIPNFFRRLFAEGSFSTAFVPILSEYKSTKNIAQTRALLDQTFATLGLALLILTAIGIICAPGFIWLFAHGLTADAQQYALASDMLRITFPYILFISLTAFAGGILNTYGHFGVPAFTPVLLNMSMILATIFLAPHMSQPIVALAIGVFIAGLIQLLFQIPFLVRLQLLPRPSLRRDKSGVKRIFQLMLPAAFASAIVQINLLVDTLIASFLAAGSISWLYFSDRLLEFPIGVFGVALATVILPAMSKAHAQQSAHYVTILDWALRLVLLIGLPAMLGLILLSDGLLSTLFQYRSFSARDVAMSAQSLYAYALGLPAFLLIKVLSAVYFSRQDTKTPVKIGVIAMLANIVFSLLLVNVLAHVGLALATSISGILQATLLYLGLRKRHIYIPQAGWIKWITKLIVANFCLGIFLYYSVAPLSAWSDWGLFERMSQLGFFVIVGVGLYFMVLWALGIRGRDIIPKDQ